MWKALALAGLKGFACASLDNMVIFSREYSFAIVAVCQKATMPTSAGDQGN